MSCTNKHTKATIKPKKKTEIKKKKKTEIKKKHTKKS